MAKVYIGTSGYSYTDWRGIFYSDYLKPEEYLSFYAQHFPFVELNFSYYRMPTSKMCLSFLNRTPAGFVFAIKGHRSLTHERKETWKTEAETFTSGIRPLSESGRLVSVLLQFPYSFHRTEKNRLYLADVCSFLRGLPLAVEFRNREWQRHEVAAELTARGITAVTTDNPSLPELPAANAIVTGPAGYIRFHGRNGADWWTGTNVSRYDYLYRRDELAEWVEPIREMIKQAAVLLIAFNNHHKGQAVRNALDLNRILEENGISAEGVP